MRSYTNYPQAGKSGLLRNCRVTSESGGEWEGTVHLPGLVAHDTCTLCGHCWPDGDVIETDDKADCKMCLDTLEEALTIARCRRLRTKKKS